MRLPAILTIISSIASILGLIIIGCSDTVGIIIALSFFCLSLSSILIAIIIVLFSFVKKSHKFPYEKVSAFTKYETEDGINILHETYSVIQSKRIILTEYKQGFKWSGSKPPEIESHLQKVERIISNDGYSYDYVLFKLNKPLIFNETGVIHFQAKMSDVDGAAKPYLDFKVEKPTNIIHYRVILKQKPNGYNQPAKFLRKKIDTEISSNYKVTDSVPFDEKSKSYEYYLIHPEVGYYYRMEWEK